DRAYVLTEQLSPEKKLEVLSDIMYIAQDRYPQTSLEWARDLWNTARLLPEDAVLDEEGSAVKAISRVDPDMALAMLMQMKVSGFTTAFGRHVPVGQGALGMTALEVFDFMQR